MHTAPAEPPKQGDHSESCELSTNLGFPQIFDKILRFLDWYNQKELNKRAVYECAIHTLTKQYKQQQQQFEYHKRIEER